MTRKSIDCAVEEVQENPTTLAALLELPDTIAQHKPLNNDLAGKTATVAAKALYRYTYESGSHIHAAIMD
jgi:hypothetical protein